MNFFLLLFGAVVGLVVGRVKRDDSVRRSLLGGGERGDTALAIMITDIFFFSFFLIHSCFASAKVVIHNHYLCAGKARVRSARDEIERERCNRPCALSVCVWAFK